MASKVRGFFADPVTFKARPETSNSSAKIIKVALGAIAIIASYIFFVPEVATGIAATIVILLSLFNLKRPSSDGSSRDSELSHGRTRYVSTFFDIFRKGRVRTSDDLPSRRENRRDYPHRDGSHVEHRRVRQTESGPRAPVGVNGSASSRESADWRGSSVSSSGSPASPLPRTSTDTRSSAAASEARRGDFVTDTLGGRAPNREVIREDRSGAVHRARAGGKK
ncbi:MAG: hypothetical protein KR126chlam6_00369 [Candidatus Anoxychlamydiales bacterium]|nr:hypothetical protein [Candidatus Anoxychlamydiales bacterium]